MAPTFPTNESGRNSAEFRGFPANGTGLAILSDNRTRLPSGLLKRQPEKLKRHAARYRNGVSGKDLEAYGELLHWFRKQGAVVHVTVAPHGATEAEKHELFDTVRKRIAEYQRRSKMSRLLSVEIRETKTENGFSLHIHIVAVFRNYEKARKFTVSVTKSKALKRLGEKAVDAVIINDDAHWLRMNSYFTEEATMQAWHGHGRSFPKPLGPFPFDGDRVVPSPDAKDWLVKSGRMADWLRTNAKRAPLPQADQVSAERPALPQLVAVPDPRGLFGELPKQATPAKEWARSSPRRLKLIIEGQANLPLERQPDVIDIMARLGLTHEAIAARIGTSRPQATNILNRQFGCSRQVARRVLQLAA